MKTEKGVTLTALVAYISVFMIIISMVTAISAHFYKNVAKVESAPKYVTEFNKFSMFFVADVKKNSTTKSNTDTSIEFDDGTKYEYKNKKIYRNGTEVAKNIQAMKFNVSNYTKNGFTKKIVRVDVTLGNGKSNIQKSVDFVLKYW